MARDLLPSPDDGPITELSAQERIFVEAYVGDARFNATQAALMAGIGGTYQSSKNVAYRLLTRADINAAVRQLTERYAVSAGEWLVRLGAHFRLDMGAFSECWYETPDGRRLIDWDQINAKGLGPFIKAVKQTKYGESLELIDVQRAQEMIGRALGLFADKLNITGKIDYDKLTDEQLEDLAAGKRPRGL